MNRPLRIAALILAFAAGTMMLDWATVPVIASMYALFRREPGATVEVSVAAAVSWLVLIGRQASAPAFGTLLTALGGIFPVPGIAVALIAVALAALLAGSAARLSLGLVGFRSGRETS